MIITDAFWEKKNLGVESCTEILFDENDKVENVGEDFLAVNAEYAVAKVPSPRVDLLVLCQKAGYAFIETNFRLKMDLNSFVMPTRFVQMQNKVKYRFATEADLSKIFFTIDKGVFDDDKIALDPWFGIEKSSNRYHNWIENSLLTGSIALIVEIDGTDFGFVIAKRVNEVIMESTFVACFLGEQQRSYGFSLAYSSFIYASTIDCTSVVTGVSSNNLASLKMHLSIGYKIDKVTYTLVKHR